MDKDLEKMLRKKLNFQIKAINKEEYIIEGVFSTAGTDRHGEIIDQKGWKLEEYMSNPVILFAHDQWTPAVGKAVEIKIDGNGNLAGKIKFAVEEYELAKTLFNLYAGKYMRAFSVGFMNEVYEVDQEKDVIILKENVLYEISCVNVPANSMALAKSKGINTEPLKNLGKKVEKAEITNKEVMEKIEEIDEIVRELKSNLDKSLRADNAVKTILVETPNGKGSVARKKATKKELNKAIRQLLRQKQNLSK